MNRKQETRRIWAWFGVIALAVGLHACGGGGGGGTATVSSGNAGRVAILLTDGPADYDEVNVWIQSIELLSDQGRALVYRSDDPVGEKRNLLDLANETELFSVQAGVPAGQYDKIRLQVSKVELIRYNDAGQPEDPIVPKLPGNGKIDLNPRQAFVVAPGETLIVRLDLDAQKSIHIVENGQKVLFRPVVFVDVLHEMVPGKLVRIRGTVEQKNESSFLLCPQGVSATAFPDYASFLSACVDVQISDQTAIFDPDGNVIPFADLAVAETVEAVGRFESAAASTDTDPTHLAGFQAFVVEMGTYLKLKGMVLAAPDVQGEVGVFPFALDRGQGITGNLEVQTHLFKGTKFFTADGTAVELGALQAGTRAMVDGVLFLSGDGISADVLKAALVIIDLSPPSDGELQGTVDTVVDRKITLKSGECAVMTSTARFFLMQQAAVGDPVEITPTDFESVTSGQLVKLYGNGSVGECLAADTGFVLQLAE